MKPCSAVWRIGSTNGCALPATLLWMLLASAHYTVFSTPWEKDRQDLLDAYAVMVRLCVGVEGHLGHDDEERDIFIQKVTGFCRCSETLAVAVYSMPALS